METKKKWLYGDAHESYPISRNEIWSVGDYEFKCVNLYDIDKIPFNGNIDYAYLDPPWNQTNLQSFHTKAELSQWVSFRKFIPHLCNLLSEVKHDVFIEMGKQRLGFLMQEIEKSGGEVLNVWNITYYKKRHCRLVRACWGTPQLTDSIYAGLDFEGMDDEKTPLHVARAIAKITVMEDPENRPTLFDACTGKGLTTQAALQTGLRFVGTELHPRRLAWAIKRAANYTGQKPVIRGIYDN